MLCIASREYIFCRSTIPAPSADELPHSQELVSKAVRQAFALFVDPLKHAGMQEGCLPPDAAVSLNCLEHGYA